METKKGYKTSEFWLTAANSIFTLLNQSGIIGTPIPTEAILMIGGTVMTYIFGRTTVKKVEAGK